MNKSTGLLIVSTVLAGSTVSACGSEEPLPGHETGPCSDDTCLEGLVCLSNVCVSPDPTEGGTATTAEPPATNTVTNGNGPGGNPSTDPATSDGLDGTTEPGEGSETIGVETATTGDLWGGCDALDVLFVIDNSGSMFDEQGTLVQAAPDFLAEVEARSGSSDHHVMVVDVDRWVFEGCEVLCAMFGQCITAPEYVCGVTMPGECEDVLGAGVVYPQGDNSSDMDCGFPGDDRFVSLSDSDALEQFSCAATVGTASTAATELTMQAMVNAVDSATPAAPCNEGFLRDDAGLVIVFMTDEDDSAEDSQGNPAGWEAALVAAKGGNADAIAVLGLFGDTDLPAGICQPLDGDMGAEASPRLVEFVEQFGPRGVRHSVCADDFAPAFQDLLGILDDMCQ